MKKLNSITPITQFKYYNASQKLKFLRRVFYCLLSAARYGVSFFRRHILRWYILMTILRRYILLRMIRAALRGLII